MSISSNDNAKQMSKSQDLIACIKEVFGNSELIDITKIIKRLKSGSDPSTCFKQLDTIFYKNSSTPQNCDKF
jgi:hypothetical protein